MNVNEIAKDKETTEPKEVKLAKQIQQIKEQITSLKEVLLTSEDCYNFGWYRELKNNLELAQAKINALVLALSLSKEKKEKGN